MKRNSKRKSYKRTISLALASCFGFVPALDADAMNVDNLVDSISGLLGGNYSAGASAGSPSTFGSNPATGIWVNDDGTATRFGTGAGQVYRGVSGGGSGLANNPQISNYNLYGASGLLSDFNLGTNYTNPLEGLSSQFSNANIYYGYRSAFAGVPTASNNLLNPSASVSNPYWTTSTGSMSDAKGNLASSLLNNPGQVSSVDTLLQNIYDTIQSINGSIGVSGSGATGVANYVADYSSSGAVGSVGANFLNALNSIQTANTDNTTSSLTGLAASINTVANALGISALGSSAGTASGKALFATATDTSGLANTYTVADNALAALQSLDTLQGLVNGGIVSTTTDKTTGAVNGYISNTNYIAAYKLYDTVTTKGYLSDITNNILNGASVSQVAAAINALNTNGKFGVATQAQLQTALNGLVNPSQYKVVYDAYDNIAKAIQTGYTPSGQSTAISYSTVFNKGANNADIINSLITFEDAYNNVKGSDGLASGNGLLTSNFLTGGVTSSTTSTIAQALYNTFNGSSAAYTTLTNALSALGNVLSPSTVYVSSTTTTNDTATTQNQSSSYPINVASPTSTDKNITSYTTQSAANKVAYNNTINTALSKLLGSAITYSDGQSTLAGLLKGGGSVASQILTAGLQNAAANALQGQNNTTNGAATVINQIRAIYTSQELLNAYIGAALDPNSNITPDTQAQILTGLNAALTASDKNQGLIAQTVYSIERLLNSNTTGGKTITAPTLSTFNTDLGNTGTSPFTSSSVTLTQMQTALNSMTDLNTMAASNTAANMVAAATQAAVIKSNLQTVVAALEAGAIEVSGATATATTLAGAFTTLSGSASPIKDTITVAAGAGQAATEAAIVALLGGTGAWTSANSATTNPLTKFSAATTTYSTITALQTAVSSVNTDVANIDAIMGAGNQVTNWGTTFLGTGLTGVTGSIADQIAAMQKAITNYNNQVEIAFTPSQQQDFMSGMATNPSATIAALEKQVQSYLSAYNTWSNIGNSTNASWDTSTPSKGVGLTSNTLSTLLTNAGAKPSIDLGFATAAANSIQTALTNIQGLVSTSDFSSSTLGTLGSISASSSTLGTLNTAVGKLYDLDPSFFGANSQTGKSPGNLSNISNIFDDNTIIQSGKVIGQPSEGVGPASDGALGGGFKANASASGYFTNLVNLNTITSLLGNVVGGTANAPTASTNYTKAFSTNGGVVNNLLGSSSAYYNALEPSSGTFKDGINSTQFIQELMSLGDTLNAAPSSISASTISTLQGYFTTPGDGTSSGALYNALVAWKAIAFPTSDAAGATSLLSQMASLVGNTNAASSAIGVNQLLTDANNLNSANTALTTAGSGLAAAQINSGLLNITSTNAAAFSQASNAATALGQLISALQDPTLSSSNTAANIAGNVVKLIQDLNTYNHNINLLNGLTATSAGTGTAGTSVASQILNYLQAKSSTKGLMTSSGTLSTNVQDLQGLLNRLQYLQGLQAKVQQAIDNNPYALVMGKDQAVNSTTFQNAATGIMGLFNTTTSGTLFTGSAGSYNPTADMTSNFQALTTAMGYEMTNLSTYNGLIANLDNSSNSILLNPTSGVAQTAAQDALDKIAQNVYSITSYLAPITPSAAGGTNANTSSFNTIQTAYNTISGSSGLGASALSSLGKLFSTGASGTAGSGAITIGDLSSPTEDGNNTSNKSTVFAGMQAIVQLNQMFGSIQTDAAGTAASQGFTNFQTSTGSTGLGALTTNITALTANLSTTGGDSLSGITAINSPQIGKVTQILQALESNSSLASIINTATTPTTGDFTGDNAGNWTALKNALTAIGVSATGIDPTSHGSDLVNFLTAAQTLIGTNGAQGGAGNGALQILNSGLSNHINPNSANLVNAIPQLIQEAQTLNSLYTTVQGSTIASTASSISSTPGLGSGGQTLWANSDKKAIGLTPAVYQAIAQVVQQADAIFSAGSASNAGSTGGVLNADQAATNYLNGLNGSSGVGADSTQPTAPGTANAPTNFAGLVVYELTQGGVSWSSNYATTIQSATSAQLAAAVSAALSSSALTPAMMQNMVESAITTVLGDSGMSSYSKEIAAITPLLNSAKATPASVLNDALNNASSLQALLSKLGATWISTNASSASSSGLLNASTIQKIETVLGNMKTSGATYTAAQDAINGTSAAAKQAQQIEAAATAQAALQNNLNALTMLGNTQFNSNTESSYLQELGTVTTAQAEYMASNYNLPALMAQLKAEEANYTGANGQAVQKSITTAYQTIMQTGNLNPSAAQQALTNLVSEVATLQDQVVSALGTLMQQSRGGGGGAQVAAEVRNGDGAHGGVLMVALDKQGGATQLLEMPAGNPQQQVNALKTLLQNLQTTSAFAKASLMKLNSDLSKMATATATATYGSAHRMVPMNSNGNMYGIDVQFGYKQFFGKKKRWGVRYYANFSYQHGTFMNSNAAELDNFVYGAGVDALYNFYESKDGKYTTGLFAGLMLDGSSWAVKGQSYYTYLMNYDNSHGGHAVMNTSYFQIPLNLGFRTNVNRHNGFEIGLRIPLAVNYYFKGELDGVKTDIAYKRNVSVYFNYVYNF
ncbi:hypothetical protein NHP21005_07550 [Helicobacter sp. NHP21005]|uniref:outer membrane protein n=1 Tax=Helicobacter felistomachi TaxID=3040201 RepID=UPI00257445D3|nr:outer membrane protein [Helicobacter sp. NHP21005]BEG57067.1 hypothetical protein NHP21005_07550 [Helicobacter sp. NHP21005]